MNIKMDDDVRAVAEFMQSSIPADRLRSVAEKVSALAPLLWGHFPFEEVRAIALVSDPPISPDGPPTQPFSSEHRLVP